MKSKTKSLLIVAILFLGTITFPLWAKQQQNNDFKTAPGVINIETKEYTVTLSIQDWNTAIYSITNPKDVAENPKEAIVKKMVDQLNKQLADTTKPKK